MCPVLCGMSDSRVCPVLCGTSGQSCVSRASVGRVTVVVCPVLCGTSDSRGVPRVVGLSDSRVSRVVWDE